MRYIAFILIMFSGSCLLHGQAGNTDTDADIDCRTAVNEADRLYQVGRFDMCIDLLESVLETCRLSRSEKLHTMEILAKAYLETDDPGKAEAAVDMMLNNFPHYDLKEQDNPESYNRLINKFKVHPKFSIGYRNTMNWQKFKPVKIYSVLDGVDYSEPYFKPKYGIVQGFDFRLYGWAELEFDGDFSLSGDLTLKWAEFERNIKAPGFGINFHESDNFVEIPVCVKRYFHFGNNLLPYVSAGLGWLRMTKAFAGITLDYENDDPSITEEGIDMMPMRNRNTYEWIAGAGIGYKLKNFRLFLDARYFGGLKSFTNPEKGLTNSMLVSQYYYVDNSVRLNQFEFGASVCYTFINSVKRVRE